MTILLPTEKNIKQYAVENFVNKACLSSDQFWEDFGIKLTNAEITNIQKKQKGGAEAG